MAFPNKTNIPIAVDKVTEMEFTPTHVTTSNFMQFEVAYCSELVPKQKINNLAMRTFARLEPLAVPTFGLATIHKKAFFVPYRVIFPAWNDFINDVTHTFSDGVVSQVIKVPSVYNSTIVKAFVENRSLTERVLRDDQASDLVVAERSVGTQITTTVYMKYNFTNLGKRAFKMLNALGYKIDWSLVNIDFEHSLLPLFSVAKVYADWYYPNQYAQDNVISNIEKWFKYDVSDINFAGSFDSTAFYDFVQFIDKVCYDNDYFTSAWDNPMSPNNGTYSQFIIKDVTKPYSQSVAANKITPDNPNGTPELRSDSNYAGASPITQFGLNALKALSDYLKRHQIAGARVIDRYLSRWGLTLPSDKLLRSLYIGGDHQEIQFGDVTATADTDGSPLGSYAGKGVSYGEGNWSFDCTEFGMLLVITSIVPKTSYYQGASRHTINLTKLDFYTPEFDNLGCQPLLTREVYMPLDAQKIIQEGAVNIGINTADQIFGYVPRYAHYKVAKDILGGDYILGSRNVGKDAWTLFRDLDNEFANVDYNRIKHDVNFVNGSDSGQYNRIFTYQDEDYDKFNIIHQFKINTSFPGHSLYDDYEFESEGKANSVTIDTGSVKAN